MRAALSSFVLLLLLSGCGGKSNSLPEEGESSESSGVLPLKTVDAQTLPKLGEKLPPLDKGRLEVSGPADWHRMGRSSAYLCAFTKERGAGIPAIIVKVADTASIDGYADVSTENVEEFAAALAPTLKDLLEDVQPMVIGPNAFARYVKKARVNNLPAEVQVLTTIQDGRMYTVDLRVRPEELLEYRDQAYAVAAGMKFGADGEPPAEAKKDQAETKPAEKTGK